MKKKINFAVMAAFYLFICNFSMAQTEKIRSNREIALNTSFNLENKVVIKWISQPNHDPVRFVVQRSIDNETFLDIQEIEVKNNGIEPRERSQFAFTDAKMLRNVEYYRIMEYERSGQSHIYPSFPVKIVSPISIVRSPDLTCILKVMVDDTKGLIALVSTEAGLGVPCDIEISGTKDLILKPSYSLNDGTYLIKLRSPTGEEKTLKFILKNDDSL